MCYLICVCNRQKIGGHCIRGARTVIFLIKERKNVCNVGLINIQCTLIAYRYNHVCSHIRSFVIYFCFERALRKGEFYFVVSKEFQLRTLISSI